MKRQIITTRDGSHTVEIPEMQVTYHSHHGAVQESMHVFIEAGLRWLTRQSTEAHLTTAEFPGIGQASNNPLRIFEMGFGTGLNAYLTALEANRLQQSIHYTSVEQYPLTSAEAAALNYAATREEQALFSRLHLSPWQADAAITPLFTLHKQQTSLLHFQPKEPVNLIYFDAFAPAAQPELWTEEVFKKLNGMLLPGGALVTYCSKGVVRRAMEAAGFIVTKIPGPPGKREMVRATAPQHTPCAPEGGT